MKFTFQRKSIGPFLLLMIVMGISSCCINCEDHHPNRGKLKLKVSDGIVDEVFVSVYTGRDVGEGELLFQGVLTGDSSIIIPSDRDISGQAVYEKNGKKVIAMDRDETEIKDRSDNCDKRDTCFVVDEGELDFELKENPF